MKTARVFRLAASMPWAIAPSFLATILTIAAGEGAGPEAVAAELGRPLDNTRTVTVRDGVAILPVIGPIVRRANVLSEVSGATSVEILARDFSAALADEEIRAIVFEVDSPGGEVTGVHELADMMFAARGQKPIVAYAGGTCASAAYWLASAADRIVVDATAIVGSIGIVMAVPNPSAESAKEVEIVSSQSPNKRLDISTDAGRAAVQATVDALAAVFVSDVSRNRGTTPDAVIAAGDDGGVMVGAAAVTAGLADEVGSLEGLIATLGAPSGANAAAQGRKESSTMAIASAARASAATPTTEDPNASDAAKPPAPDATAAPMSCAGCHALNAAGSKFCAQCGAAFPGRNEDDEDDEEDEDDDEENDQRKAEGVAAILAVTRRRSLAGALGVIHAWAHAAAELPKVRAELAQRTAAQSASRIDALVAKARERRALTPALERELRALAAINYASAASFADALPPLAALAPPTAEPPVTGRSDAEGAPPLHNGKPFEALPFATRAELFRNQRELYELMKADAVRRGAVRA